jgi:PAS domain S-box-containing protein
MDTKNFFVAIYDEKTGMLTAPFEKDEHDSIPEWAAEKSLTGKVIKEKKSLLIRRAEIEELARSGSIDLIGTTAESWLGVPLRAGDRVTGAIVIQSFDNPNAYDSASIEILEIVAHEISIYLEREKAEASALKLSKAVIQSPVSIIITDWSGKIEYVNPKFTEVSGYAYEEVIGQNPRILQSGRQSKEVYEGLWMTILSGKDWQGELMNKKKNGELFWENVVISAIVNDEGDITHFVAVKEDITEKKRMIDQVIAAKENAEEMNKVKSSFFANMSHELRTPLIGILGFAEILEEELKRTPDTQRMVETIKISGQRLLGTLNFILDISKLEAKKTQVNLQSTNIIAVLSESANLFTSAATKRKLSYVISFPSDVIYCIIDPVLLRVVIDNLLNNAIRFTDRGKICVSAVIKDGHAIIEISDTGIGIPPEKQQIIWEEFRQASEGHSRNYEGTGLGLTIAKKYTELMHGTIALKSAVNVGTTFTLSFPLVQSQGAQSTVEAVVGMAGGEPPIQTRPRPCILYVEDDGIAIDLVSRYTHGLYVIETAGQGDTALRLAQEKQYDAILMDINLRSGMDGTQVTEKIRELPEYKETPIIAITAYAMEKEIQDFLQRGMSHYISKPFSKKDLLLLLGSVFQGSRFNP